MPLWSQKLELHVSLAVAAVAASVKVVAARASCAAGVEAASVKAAAECALCVAGVKV